MKQPNDTNKSSSDVSLTQAALTAGTTILTERAVNYMFPNSKEKKMDMLLEQNQFLLQQNQFLIQKIIEITTKLNQPK